MLKFNALRLVRISLVILFFGTQVCGQDKNKLPIPQYLNQVEYDSAYHLIYQDRSLNLELEIDQPLNLSGKPFITNTSWREENAVTQQISEDGNFSQEINYGESKIDIEIPLQHLNPNEDLESIAYHWFYPNQWFESLKLDVFTEQLSAKYKPSKKPGLIEIELSYPNQLKITEAHGSFGTMLGWEIDLKGKYKNRKEMYWIKRKKRGKLIVIADLRDFFKENNKNYSTPYTIGEKFNLSFILVPKPQKYSPKSIKSSQKGLIYKPIKYDSSRRSGRGNPYVDIPETTPQYQIIINTSKEVIIQAEHLDF